MKYQARMEMLLLYCDKQVAILMKKNPDFKVIEQDFRKPKVMVSVCEQYLKEESLKIKELFEQHEKKLDEIEEYKKMNEEIRRYNEIALKKRQREYL